MLDGCGFFSMLHDIGKDGIAITSSTRRLAERREAGSCAGTPSLLPHRKSSPDLSRSPIHLTHHERWDGTASAGSEGGEIPLLSRFSRWPTPTTKTQDRRLPEGADKEPPGGNPHNAGTQFDPFIAQVFHRFM